MEMSSLMYSNNLWEIYSFLPIKNDYLSPLGNRILWTFKKSFMKLDTVITLVYQKGEKRLGFKNGGRTFLKCHKVATRWCKMQPRDWQSKIKWRGFLKNNSVKCAFGVFFLLI